jgi:hypothetical protein
MAEGCVGSGLAVLVVRGDFGNFEQTVNKSARLNPIQRSAILFFPAIMRFLSLVVPSFAKKSQLTKAIKRK